MSHNRTEPKARFDPVTRLLHWVVAAAVIAQLFIAAVMVSSLLFQPLLVAIHKPLGLLILVVVIVRLINRLAHRSPTPLATMGRFERFVATASEFLMYGLLLLQPLVGWAVVSASGVPVIIFGSLVLPPIAPNDAVLYGLLERSHRLLAYALLAVFTAHLCAVLFHTLVLRDGLFARIALWTRRRR